MIRIFAFRLSLRGVPGVAGADTGGVDRVDIHPPFFSKKKFEMSLYLK